MSDEYLSSDFNYKNYSLQQLDNWVSDAMNCEDLTPQDIYDIVIKCVDDNIEYHKKYLTKGIELLSLLKNQRKVDYIDFDTDEKDWENFWYEQNEISQHYSDEDLNAMCDAAADKEKCREYNMREAEYYNKRAQLDLEETAKQLEIARKVDSGEVEVETRNRKTYDEMIEEGWQMTDDGFWIKETEKGTLSISG